jgi:hypothetical protein
LDSPVVGSACPLPNRGGGNTQMRDAQKVLCEPIYSPASPRATTANAILRDSRDVSPKPTMHQFEALYWRDDVTTGGWLKLATRASLRIQQRMPNWPPSIDRAFRDFSQVVGCRIRQEHRACRS